MARLPKPGGRCGQHGSHPNDYLSQSQEADGSLKDGVVVGTLIADSSIPVLKQVPSIQSSLALAHTAIQPAQLAAKYTKPVGGIPLADLKRADLDGTNAPLDLVPDGITYNSDGTVATSTEGGVTTTYTWNSDRNCHTETRLGKTKTWTYNSSGNLIPSVVV